MWKDIIDFEERYEISDSGDVRNKKNKHILTPKVDRYSYNQIGLRKLGDRKKYWFSVHRLVGLHFLEHIVGMQIDHIDHNKLNNVISNLRWVTPSNNNLNRELKAWKTNRTGELYITEYKHGYMIRINRSDYKRKVWTNTLENAISQRNNFLKEIKNI
jgi:hypothetical protein